MKILLFSQRKRTLISTNFIKTCNNFNWSNSLLSQKVVSNFSNYKYNSKLTEILKIPNLENPNLPSGPINTFQQQQQQPLLSKALELLDSKANEVRDKLINRNQSSKLWLYNRNNLLITIEYYLQHRRFRFVMLLTQKLIAEGISIDFELYQVILENLCRYKAENNLIMSWISKFRRELFYSKSLVQCQQFLLNFISQCDQLDDTYFSEIINEFPIENYTFLNYLNVISRFLKKNGSRAPAAIDIVGETAALKYFNMMISNGIKPSELILCKFFEYYSNCEEFDKIFQWGMEQMKRFYIKPSPILTSAIMSKFIKAKRELNKALSTVSLQDQKFLLSHQHF